MHACAANLSATKYHVSKGDGRTSSIGGTRVDADNIAQLSNMPNIGSKPSQPRHFNFPKRPFGKKNVVYRSFQAAYTMIVPEMWHFASLA